MKQKKQQKFFKVTVELRDNKLKVVVPVRASNSEVACDRALKRKPNAHRVLSVEEG